MDQRLIFTYCDSLWDHLCDKLQQHTPERGHIVPLHCITPLFCEMIGV